MNDEGRVGAAILFIASSTNAMDVYSAVNSSPWTGYNFANDDRAREALRYYVAHAIVITTLTNVGGAIIARSWWPILGAGIASTYMYWLYEDAIAKGKAENSQGWDTPQQSGGSEGPGQGEPQVEQQDNFTEILTPSG